MLLLLLLLVIVLRLLLLLLLLTTGLYHSSLLDPISRDRLCILASTS